jgi:hypothetical protein
MRAGLALGAASCALLLARGASAQIHADADLEVGASAHFLSSRPGGSAARNPDAGPTIALLGHVAVLPLLRAGLYVSHDFSPLPGADLREITSFGLSARLFSPWPRGVVRAWLGTGFGYAVGYSPGYPANLAPAGPSQAVSGAAGGYFEVPAALGSSLQLSRRFELLASAGVRLGFGFTGAMYEEGPAVPGGGRVPPAGDDVLAVFVVIGAAFEL